MENLKEKIELYKEKFDKAFPLIVNELIDHEEQNPDLQEAANDLRKALEYNTFDGKKSRGLMVICTVDFLRDGQPSEEDVKKAIYLGWCIEILQALFLVADDIMDKSELRRGRPCWYKKVGLVSINHTFLLEQCIYKLIDDHFRNDTYLFELYKAFHKVTYLTAMGQELDMIASEPQNATFDLDMFTEEKYRAIVKYKTAYYSFYLPVSLGMHIANVTDPELFKEAEKILVKLGEYFQVQDDYLDCYGEPSVIGKIGRDIEDAKCSWLVVQALKRVTPEQKARLKANYGKEDQQAVAIVKEIYKQVELETVYKEYEEASYKSICNLITSNGNTEYMKQLFLFLVMKIYKRQK